MAANKKTVLDAFIAGINKGLKISATSMLPNVMMAFGIIYLLNTTGLLNIIGTIFKPIMALVGLPGEGAAVFMSSLMSGAGASGMAISMRASGQLTSAHCVILLPGIALVTGTVQYIGRILGINEMDSRYYILLPILNIIVGFIGMFIMNIALKLF